MQASIKLKLMRLLILSTNKQRDENIFPVVRILTEKFGVICDYVVTNNFCLIDKPFFINKWVEVNKPFFGKKVILNASDNGYGRRFKNLLLLKSFLTNQTLNSYDALLIGGDDYLGRYFLKKFRSKKRFLIQDGLFFNVTSKLIYHEILKGNKKSYAAYLFFIKYLFKEFLIKIVTFLDISYLFFSYSGKSEFDLFFISGSYTKKILNNQGVLDNRMLLSGLPRFKYLFNDSVKKQYKVPPFNKTSHAITFMTGAYKNHSQYEMDICEKKFLKELCLRIESLKDLHLYIKVHPRDIISDFEQFSNNDFVSVIADVPIERVLNESDIIMANASTTTVEAAFMNTPVIITLVSFIQTFRFSSYFSYDRNYYCVAETWDEVEYYIVKILNDQEYRNEVIRKQRTLTEALICSETINSDIIIANEIAKCVTKAG